MTHEADGSTLYTVPMQLVRAATTRPIPDGYGQNPGNCGTAKLWTYANSHQFRLSLIGNPGVFLGLGAYEFTTNALFSLPVYGAIEAKGPTWTSGLVDVPAPGLFAKTAVVGGEDNTSIGFCSIVVTAPWS